MGEEERPAFNYRVELSNTGNVSELIHISLAHKSLSSWYPVIYEKEVLVRPGGSREIEFRLVLPDIQNSDDLNNYWNGDLSLRLETDSTLVLSTVLNKPANGKLVLDSGSVNINDLSVDNTILCSVDLVKDEDRAYLDIDWDMGDGQHFNETDFSYKYGHYGNYLVVCTLSDSSGIDTILKGSLRMNNLPPTAKIVITSQDSSNTSIPMLENITLSAAQSSDGDGELVAYKWTLNDNVLGEGKYLTTSFAKKGQYTVILEVTDSGGDMDTATLSIDVTDALVKDDPGTVDSGDDESSGLEKFLEENDQVIEYVSIGLLLVGLLLVVVLGANVAMKKKTTKDSQKEIKEIEKYLGDNKGKN